ncbi:MAG TPA: endonuclease Q family protein [Bacillota bacterium]|nr:endonuclease Q family protein [Bacillota bacterium]
MFSIHYVADLHIHSHYSMATSKECNPEQLYRWAAIKGIGLMGTGDFTHPAWREELRTKLIPAEDGLFCLKKELIPADTSDYTKEPLRFVLSGEISTIYKKNGRTRKVHHLILLPGFAEADAISRRLEEIGNIRSDGRPILGLDSQRLLEIVLDESPEAIFIPAHIWTPHFSVFGAFSGFESIEECYGDLSPMIFALETGLSSDPEMNWRLSNFDRFTLLSNSDAHSPLNLAREANLFDGELSYQGLRHSLNRSDQGFAGTIEFFPEEGKYHLDGHRNCGVRLTPEETRKNNGRCPVCGRPVTIGVLNRIERLADREAGFRPISAKPFERLIPLLTILGELMGRGKKAARAYEELTKEFGSELRVLRETPIADLRMKMGEQVGEAILRVRQGDVHIIPGFDGEYGKVSVFGR